MSPDMKQALLILGLFAALLLIFLFRNSDVHSQEQAIRCENGVCLIDQQHLELLVQLARRAEEYRDLCGWNK